MIQARVTRAGIGLLIVFVMTLTATVTKAQGRLILNGGTVNITNGAVLVISNPATNAITRTSGHIISEGQNNLVRWNIGTTSGTYTIPWGSGASNYFPVSFTTSAASGSGYLNLATVATPADNSSALPTGVSNFNGAVGEDMSLVAVDRFWKIDAQSYTTKPTLTNLIFTYIDAEYASPNKTAVENKLTARRWNSTSGTWTDYNTGGTVNTTANTITVASLAATNLYPWWSVAYPGAVFHWIPAANANWNSAANWAATEAGPGGLGVPGPGDVVWFDDARDANCNINTAVDVARLTMNTGYTGTVVQNNNAISVAGQATLSSGTFNGGAGTFTVSGNFNLSGATFNAPATLDLKKELNITAGTFNHNNGKVRFTGTTGTQQLNASTTIGLNSIDVTNVSAVPGMRFESNANLSGVLTLGANVTVDADGASDNKILTLLSTNDSPTSDAAIGILPAGAQVAGKVTVQRYMSIEGPNNKRIYRYISSPVQHATVADLQQELLITGTFTGKSSCSGCGSNQSMFAYKESVITDTNNSGTVTMDDGYIDFPDVANTEEMETGRGYATFVRGNQQTSAKWDVRGVINSGNVTPVTLPMTFTSSGSLADDGWNLVGNPYPSTIDWSAASGWTKTNIDNAIYTRDNGNDISRFATWNGVVGTNGGSRYVATGQAFWVKANGNGTPVLRANENVKAAGTQATFFRETTPSNVFRITLAQGAISDEAVVHFRKDASDKFDPAADARKMLNNGINISTQIAGKEKLAINSLSKTVCDATVQVLVENAAKGTYTLNFSSIETFPKATTILLTDNFTGTTVDARSQASYSFDITADAASASTTRFSLSFSTPLPSTEFMVTAPAVCSNAQGNVTLTGVNGDVSYDILMGTKTIGKAQVGTSDTIRWEVAKEKLTKSSNLITLRATPLTCGLPSEKQVQLSVVETVSPQSVTGGSVCREGVVTLSASGAAEGNNYRWYENETDVTPLMESPTPVFNTPVLTSSKTYFVTVVNALGCEGNRMSVPAEVVQYEDAVINLVDDSLHVNFTDGVQWYFNDALIEGAQSSTLFKEAFGKYDVTVTVGSCVTQATYLSVEEVTAVEQGPDYIVHVFPNPVVNELHLELGAAITKVKEVIVRNEQGQRIGEFVLTHSGSGRTGTFNMASKASGLYTVEIVTDNTWIPVKIIKK